jgi:hypothetical protein
MVRLAPDEPTRNYALERARGAEVGAGFRGETDSRSRDAVNQAPELTILRRCEEEAVQIQKAQASWKQRGMTDGLANDTLPG